MADDGLGTRLSLATPAAPGRMAPDIAPVISFVVVSVVFVGFVLNAFGYVIVHGTPLPGVLVAGAVLAALVVLQLGVISNAATDPRSRRMRLACAVQAALVLAPLPFYGPDWLGMPGFLAGSALLVLPGRWRWFVFALVGLGGGVLAAVYWRDPLQTVYVTVLTALTGLIVYGLSRLRELVLRLHAARSEIAELAVGEERLRLAHDMHELLDDRLSAIALRSELARRLVRSPGPARAELAAVLELSRHALADVREAAHSYRAESLRDEVSSVRSALRAGGIAVTVDLDDGIADLDAEPALVAGLRAGVDTMLHHSRPRTCTLTVARSGAGVRLEIVNDGAPDPPEPGAAGAFDELAAQLRAAGGSLVAGPAAPGSYRLGIDVPRVRSPSGGRRSPVAPPDPTWELQPGPARTIVIAVLSGYFVTAVVTGLQSLSGVGAALSIACLTGVLALQLGVLSRVDPGPRRVPPTAALLLQALLVVAPTVAFGAPASGLAGFVAGSALLVLRPIPAWVVFAAVTAGVATAYAVFFAGDPIWPAYAVIATVNRGLVVYGLTRLRSLVDYLHEARTELVTLAVTQERLRFARDLHDLLGYSLSAITLKTELATRLVEAGAVDPARTEIEEVLGITHRALADVRAVAGQRRELALDDEIASVASVLATADVELDVRGCGAGLPPPVASVLAVVVREGVTNVLRHSEATWCAIGIEVGCDAVRLVVENDGAHEQPGGPPGSGIANLTARVQATDGTFTAGPEAEGRYRIAAEIPVPAPAQP